MIELKIPEVGESITEVEIGEWLKFEGERVEKDENVVVIETEKVTVELPAPAAGIVTGILKRSGEKAGVGEVIGRIEPQAGGPAKTKPVERKESPGDGKERERAKGSPSKSEVRVMPAARRALAEHGVRADEVQASGPGNRLLKEDVARHVERQEADRDTEAGGEKAPPTPVPAPQRGEEVVPMSPLRREIAKRLVAAQQSAALLTTFNEIELSAVNALRAEHRSRFEEKYGIKLGLMSFFVKAATDALKLVPQVNAKIRGNDIVFHNYYDIGVAIGSGKGLVVPVLRNAERMSFAEIELAIADFARRAQENKLKLEELQGGTFTISNGGIYGSLLSTPSVNPPQSGILGMHAIQERPVARDGAVVVRPMMYVALTYDHRIIDGREAVTFLRRIKEAIEDPARMLLEV
ncbi:MAG: 2-oxoglutarate dehydrogenase complex dihydrolipoyllysine-residue succinyltransferase [Candidatus Binatia bacterium]